MKNKIKILMAMILVIISLAACTNTDFAEVDLFEQTPEPKSTNAQFEPEEVDSIDPEPEQVNSDEELGYGAVGSFLNEEPTLEQMLTYAIQDEYLARSEYGFIIDELNASTPFTNIIKAEENHIEMLVPLFEKYEFAMPDDTSKEYLIVPETITQALETGVQAEIDNIAMYEFFLTLDLPDDARDTFVSLRDASEKHLEAFQRKLSRSNAI